jgi:hypothetical protein
MIARNDIKIASFQNLSLINADNKPRRDIRGNVLTPANTSSLTLYSLSRPIKNPRTRENRIL